MPHGIDPAPSRPPFRATPPAGTLCASSAEAPLAERKALFPDRLFSEAAAADTHSLPVS